MEGLIRDYIIHIREDRKRCHRLQWQHTPSAIAHFFEMNDVIINWKKLKKFKGKKRQMVEDVPYTRDQIKTMIDLPSSRDRCMILVMASAGLRRGGFISHQNKRFAKDRQIQLIQNHSLQERARTIYNVLHS